MDARRRLAANVRRLRSDLGLTQEQLADQVEIDRTYMSGIERALRNPSLDVIDKLASALNVSIGALVDHIPAELIRPGRSHQRVE